MVETMRWRKGRLDLLDQTLLPKKWSIARCAPHGR